MKADHHKVRVFVMLELPRMAKPIPSETIAQSLNMEDEQVISILDELEKNSTFLYRNEALTFTIQTECAHCGKEIRIAMDNELNYSVADPDANLLIFVPMVDFSTWQIPALSMPSEGIQSSSGQKDMQENIAVRILHCAALT